MRMIIIKVSNGALVKAELNKNETESGKHEESQKVFKFDDDNPDGIIEMLQEIFENVIFLGDSKYDKEGTEFVCELIKVHGRRYDSSQCEPECRLCRNTKSVEDLHMACRNEGDKA